MNTEALTPQQKAAQTRVANKAARDLRIKHEVERYKGCVADVFAKHTAKHFMEGGKGASFFLKLHARINDGTGAKTYAFYSGYGHGVALDAKLDKALLAIPGVVSYDVHLD